ncbi:triose-phosphate isomerase [Candidatus Endobugula sertula]|uniref:Triosephosphate isomerase n=1 Tax=Candidatus Endobugula sertula TaxID=62101 RepID=A0A1D2QNB7_9GAMM|nr:triose-phosphate isomerase [Candidatus Endobugula sertula]
MRRPLVIGNWKMNGSRQDNKSLLEELVFLKPTNIQTELVICAPFLYIEQVSRHLVEQQISFGAQDMSVHLNGAYTGEISASMLIDLGCRYVIVGHSERRQYHGESNLLVAQKTLASLQAGLIPIICVGETLEQRESAGTLDVIADQLAAVKTVVGDSGISRSVIAYEPVWAIGTGLSATPDQAQDVHRFIRGQLGATGGNVRLLYGGSVKSDNAAGLFEQPDIDGALVGGASLVAREFIKIALAAA